MGGYEQCRDCRGQGEQVECRGYACSHTNDPAWTCRTCDGEGSVPARPLLYDVEAAVAQFQLRQQLRDAGLPLVMGGPEDFARTAAVTGGQTRVMKDVARLRTVNAARRCNQFRATTARIAAASS